MTVDDQYENGIRLYASGRYAEAEMVFRGCLALCPENPDLLNALGSAIEAGGGSSEEAATLLEEACRIRPESAPFHYNLANILRKMNKREKAENEYLEALKYNPDIAEALHGLGSIYLEEGRLEPAEACLLKAVEISPGLSPALHDLGQLRQRLGSREEAEHYFRRCIAVNPAFVPALNSLGMLLLRLNRVEEARSCLEKAIEINPDYLQARCNLAVLATWCGELDFAIRELRCAAEAAPNDGDIHFNLSLALLASGNMNEGFREHEWRFRKANPVQMRHEEIPRWNGEPLAGKRILIHAEQGYGDSLQFIRYAPLLAAQGGIVFVEGQDRIITPLLATVKGVTGAVARGDDLPAVDLQIPIMSLPLALGELAWPPPTDSYLNPLEDKKSYWRKRLSALPGYKVGLAWAGRPEHENDAVRSLAESALAPLGNLPGVSYVSLQFGSRNAADLPFSITDYCADITDFSDSAALTSCLDLVITVDSAIAHLAGGLGVPVFLLLPWNPDWRWMHNRRDSLWYPSVRIYRQCKPSAWSNVIDDVVRDLKKSPACRSGL